MLSQSRHKLALLGASGRMGRKVYEVIHEFPDFQLAAALVSSRSSQIGKRCAAEHPLEFSTDIAQALAQCDCIMDFSEPRATQLLMQALRKHPKPVLIGTTGHNQEQLQGIQEIAEIAPVILASNTSLGVFVVEQLARHAQKLLGSSFEIEIIETHHAGKKDFPSGTAGTLARALNSDGSKSIVQQRSAARAAGEIGITSVRGGDVIGDHTILFLGKGERVEITHRATERSLFARGAFILLEKLLTRRAGLFTPADLLK